MPLIRSLFFCILFVVLPLLGTILVAAAPSTLDSPRRMVLNHQLETAVMQGNQTQIVELIKKGADVDTRNDLGQTLLEVEAEHAFLPSAQLLLQNGANPNAESAYGTPLSQAAALGSVPMVNLLLDHGANANSRNCPIVAALNYAVGAKPEDITGGVSSIVVQVNPNTAAKRRMALKLLRKEEISVRKWLVKTQMEQIANLHSDGMQVVRVLLARGADVNSRTEFGETPLIASAHAGSLEAATLLVDRGASVSACDKDGRNALMYAAASGAADVVNFLLAKGASVNIRDTRHGTAITLTQSVSVIRSLIKAGADVNAQDQFGYSALREAVIFDNKAVVQYLLSRGANPNLTEKSGTTIMQAARMTKDVSLLHLLKRAGAK